MTSNRLLYVSSVHMNPEYQIIVITYLCRRSGGEVTFSDEHSAYQWADVAALRKYLAGDIVQALDQNELWRIFASSTERTEIGGK